MLSLARRSARTRPGARVYVWCLFGCFGTALRAGGAPPLNPARRAPVPPYPRHESGAPPPHPQAYSAADEVRRAPEGHGPYPAVAPHAPYRRLRLRGRTGGVAPPCPYLGWRAGRERYSKPPRRP